MSDYQIALLTELHELNKTLKVIASNQERSKVNGKQIAKAIGSSKGHFKIKASVNKAEIIQSCRNHQKTLQDFKKARVLI